MVVACAQGVGVTITTGAGGIAAGWADAGVIADEVLGVGPSEGVAAALRV